jgi:adenylyltransferase/sulfurtransferase
MPNIRTITAVELRTKLDNKEDFVLIDVREPNEWEICHIKGAELKPLSRIAEWVSALDPAKEYVFQCHHGVRSAQACALAQSNGVKNVINLTGGIDAWCGAVEPEMRRY